MKSAVMLLRHFTISVAYERSFQFFSFRGLPVSPSPVRRYSSGRLPVVLVKLLLKLALLLKPQSVAISSILLSVERMSRMALSIRLELMYALGVIPLIFLKQDEKKFCDIPYLTARS